MVNAIVVGLAVAAICLLIALLLIRQARRLDEPVVDLGYQGFLVPTLLVIAAFGRDRLRRSGQRRDLVALNMTGRTGRRTLPLVNLPVSGTMVSTGTVSGLVGYGSMGLGLYRLKQAYDTCRAFPGSAVCKSRMTLAFLQTAWGGVFGGLFGSNVAGCAEWLFGAAESRQDVG
jgi:hypothetical protein